MARGTRKNKAQAATEEVFKELTDIALGRKSFEGVDKAGNKTEQIATVPERIKAAELILKHKSQGKADEPIFKIIDDIVGKELSDE